MSRRVKIPSLNSGNHLHFQDANDGEEHPSFDNRIGQQSESSRTLSNSSRKRKQARQSDRNLQMLLGKPMGSNAAREAIIEWKFGQIVRNMQLEQISETVSEDRLSTSSDQFEDFQSDFGSLQGRNDSFDGSSSIGGYARARPLSDQDLNSNEFDFSPEMSNRSMSDISNFQGTGFYTQRSYKSSSAGFGVSQRQSKYQRNYQQFANQSMQGRSIESDSIENENNMDSEEQLNRNIIHRLYKEAMKSFNKIVHYIIVNIIVVAIRMIELCWLIGLALVARALRWQLDVLKWILKSVIQGICCIGCFSCYGCLSCVFGKKSAESGKSTAIKPKRAKRQHKVEVGSVFETGGDSTSESESTGPQPLLIMINLDKVLVYSSLIAPQFHLPFTKPCQPSTSIPFRIELKKGTHQNEIQTQDAPMNNNSTALYIHPRPFLPQFLEHLHQMGENVEVAIYSNQSQAYVDEVLNWIDGRNWCQYRFYNDGHMRGSLHRDTDQIFRKIKQIRAKRLHEQQLKALDLSTSFDITSQQRTKGFTEQSSPILGKKAHIRSERLDSNNDNSSDDQSFQSVDENDGYENVNVIGTKGTSRSMQQATNIRNQQKSDISKKSSSEFQEAKNLIKSISSICDQIEDEIRDHQLVQECMETEDNTITDLRAVSMDLIRSEKYIRHVQTPIQKRVILIDDELQSYQHTAYRNNVISIKPWRNDNQRDHVLKDCLAIIKQMRHTKNVSKDLPQFVELYNQLIKE